METSVKQRLINFIEYKGLSIRKFELTCGLSIGYMKSLRHAPSMDKLSMILSAYPDLNRAWLLTGEGAMLKDAGGGAAGNGDGDTRPRVPYTAAAGTLTDSVEGIAEIRCERTPRVSNFPAYDFTIVIRGDSMEPEYHSGDEVACRRIDATSFVQWGKTHVLDTAQGGVMKRVYDDGDNIRCVSYNDAYPDFSIAKSDIYSINLVVGLLRLT